MKSDVFDGSGKIYIIQLNPVYSPVVI